ncbi:MAG: hypothetical protein H6Q89_3807, partial [Myxococcaceae bacterium]|nr:hypothetical protein [Myxococcaceae bacterium]
FRWWPRACWRCCGGECALAGSPAAGLRVDLRRACGRKRSDTVGRAGRWSESKRMRPIPACRQAEATDDGRTHRCQARAGSRSVGWLLTVRGRGAAPAGFFCACAAPTTSRCGQRCTASRPAPPEAEVTPSDLRPPSANARGRKARPPRLGPRTAIAFRLAETARRRLRPRRSVSELDFVLRNRASAPLERNSRRLLQRVRRFARALLHLLGRDVLHVGADRPGVAEPIIAPALVARLKS